MCHLSQDVENPTFGADADNPEAGLGAEAARDLSASGQSVNDPFADQDTDESSSTSTTTQPTKFAKLLKVALPIVQGGMVGGFGGNWRVPGSGLTAAENFYAIQARQKLAEQQLQRQTQSDYFKNMLDAARAQHEINQPPTLGAGYRPFQKMVDGKPHQFVYDPDKRQYVDQGEVPPKEATGLGSTRTISTPAGPQLANVRGTSVTPITMPQPARPTAPLGSVDREVEDEAEQDLQSRGVTPNTVEMPVEPYEAPVKVTSTDASGKVSTDQFVDRNTGKPTSGPVDSRTRPPARPTGGRGSSTQTAIPGWGTPTNTQGRTAIEQVAKAALDANGNDVDKADKAIIGNQNIPDSFKSYVRSRIREMAKKAPKPKAGLTPEQLKALAGSVPQG